MKSPSLVYRARLRAIAWHLLPPLLYVGLVWVVVPFRGHFQLDLDEGGNLMKALLLQRGYGLYSEIWSDQPPLFTWLLAQVFRFGGLSPTLARLLVLVFAALLVWAGVQILRRVWGSLAAVLGLLFLILLPLMVKLSVSVMIGLPAIALALAAVYALVAWHQVQQTIWLLLAALLLALSVYTKLFTAFLAPVFALGLLLAGRHRQPQSGWRAYVPLLQWLTAFLGAVLLLGASLLDGAALGQLLFSHWQARTADYYAGYAHLASINYHLRPIWPLLGLALLGGVECVWHRRYLGLYLAAWFLGAYALLWDHRPAWSHLQLLITVPAALLAAGGVAQALHLLALAIRRPAAERRLPPGPAAAVWLSAVSLGVILFTLLQAPAQVSSLARMAQLPNPLARPTSTEAQILGKMLKYAPQTDWVLTDLPLYAFLIQCPTPPELAVISDKRVVAGELDEVMLQRALQRWQPEQILLGRFDFSEFEADLQPEYRLVEQRGELRLYVRAGLE